MEQLEHELHCAGFNVEPEHMEVVVQVLQAENVSAIVHLHGVGPLSEFEGFNRLYHSEVQQLVECASRIAAGALVITESVRANFDRASNQIVKHLNVTGRGTQEFARLLKRKYPDAASKAAWASKARTNALLGSCPKSKASLRCGARNYISLLRIC